METTAHLAQAAEALRRADAVLITAGAGIGVDSGLPDFRGNQGFWKAYPPIAKLGLAFSDIANPHWFERNPRLAWAFYGHRLNLYRKTRPHHGFTQLLELAEQKPGGYFVFTSNVDGQFQKAGFRDAQVEECHGSIHYFQCSRPCTYSIWDAAHITVNVDEAAFEARDPLPRCIHCGALARPNILMFGDWTWIPDRTDSQSHRLSDWIESITREHMRLVVVEIGAGEAVPTVRLKSEYVARARNATLIRINPRDYAVPHGHIPIALGGAEGVARIYQQIRAKEFDEKEVDARQHVMCQDSAAEIRSRF